MPRLIDADALIEEWHENPPSYDMDRVFAALAQAPTVSGWVSVEDDMPKEHNSIFANYTHLSKHMWAKESDNVIVYVRFPDGTGRATEGGLHDGKWWTRISPALEPIVTHWMPLPEPPEEGKE